ncbi:MAG: glycosyltransferase family 52 protein [Clostridium sp.]|jgi:hypothetical protein|nr:glycosyltransferase family 52 protein [Clostridium sp.]
MEKKKRQTTGLSRAKPGRGRLTREKAGQKDRIYVCHTYYHVYVTFLKELNLPAAARGRAVLVLSRMSSRFEDLQKRVESTGLFARVVEFDEKREDFFPELAKWRTGTGNLWKNLFRRMVFTRKYAKLEEPYIPVDFREYREVYVYCDSDPIGYYLNWKHIPYYALEDGLNCLKNFDAARYDNRGHFRWKVFLSRRLNLIFVQNGYGKYCITMEVNDIAAIPYPCPRYVEQSRQELADRLTREDRELILRAFIRDRETLRQRMDEVCREDGDDRKSNILILTDPLCTLEVRERIFRDIIAMYEPEGRIFLKPHPRDELDYRTLFADYPQFDAAVPMEILNFFPELRFRKVVGVLTELSGIRFAEEKIRLGEDFMDAYEDPPVHRQNEQIRA